MTFVPDATSFWVHSRPKPDDEPEITTTFGSGSCKLGIARSGLRLMASPIPRGAVLCRLNARTYRDRAQGGPCRSPAQKVATTSIRTLADAGRRPARAAWRI